MKSFFRGAGVVMLAFVFCVNFASAQDQGKKTVGKLKVSLYFGTDGDPSVSGAKAQKVEAADEKRMKGSEVLRFKHYRLLGSDLQSILRSYENWIAPMKPSEEILLSFEPRGEPRDGALALDLEFWQSRKKIMKSGPLLKVGEPIYILGPSWRGGKLIISVELQSLNDE